MLPNRFTAQRIADNRKKMSQATRLKIAYLLHRFPRQTDTFIMREIRALDPSIATRVISVWPPSNETTPALMREWSHQTTFLLDLPSLTIFAQLISVVGRHPLRFVSCATLALKTIRPGIRGLLNQLFYLAEALLASRALMSNQIDHVHNHFGDHSGTVTMLAAHFSGISYSVSFHGPHVFFDGPHRAMHEKVRRAKFCRCISYYCRSQLMLMSGVMNIDHFPIIRCGIDVSRYAMADRRSDIKIGFCAARLVPEKGFVFLLRAMGLLKKDGISFNLRVAGAGPLRADLEMLANSEQIEDQVVFLGSLNEDEIAGELTNADIFILPSLAEGLPVSIMEAMASGVMVIASDIAGISEIIEDGVTGRLVRATDIRQLADKLQQTIVDPSARLSMTTAARRRVKAEYSIAFEAAKLSQLFHDHS